MITDLKNFDMIFRMLLNLFVAFVLVHLIYDRRKQQSDYSFSLLMFSTLIFLVCYLLINVNISIGFAFGLFAIFAILRYRTAPIPIREMTYLFAVITLAVINGIGGIGPIQIIVANGAVLFITFILEKVWMRNFLQSHLVIYEKIENITVAKRSELMDDLRLRTGLDIKRIVIKRTNFLKDIARIRIYYTPLDQ
ncbi:MAG: DUF4956 domain-containing protein [Candidatus Marinimicrobia bacterium]|nr:DUF4956 domain-containing protein [Candidatus Neomarinimicrobiota bacterium]